MISMFRVSVTALSALLFACGGSPGTGFESQPNDLAPGRDSGHDAGHVVQLPDAALAQTDAGVPDDAADAGPAIDAADVVVPDWHVECAGTMMAPVGNVVMGPWSYVASVSKTLAQVSAGAPANGTTCTGSGTDTALDKPAVTLPCDATTTYTVSLDRKSMVVYVALRSLDAEGGEHFGSWTFSDSCVVR